MEVKKEILQTQRQKGAAATQVTFDESYNLPDYLPDFFSLILSKGDVRMDEVKLGPGQVNVKGSVKFKVLYRTGQTDWKVSSLEGELPFQETLILEAADEFDMPQAETVLEDLTIQMMNSRKLNIRALLAIKAAAWERCDLQLPVEVQAEQMPEILKMQWNALELCYRGKERCRIREEIKLSSNKPNIRQILWQQAQMFGMEIRTFEGTVNVQGEIQIFLVYLSEEEGAIQWFETKVPYQCAFQIPEADLDVIPYIIMKPQDFHCSVEPDADGEERNILAEADLPADIWLYREQKKELIQDLYALDQKLVLETEAVQAKQLHMRSESKCRVNDMIRLDNTRNDILQICAGFGEADLDQQKIVENGIAVEGTVRVQVLYLTSSDSVPIEAAEGILPFSYIIEIPDIAMDSQAELQFSLELLSFLMKSSKELEIQAVVNFQTLVTNEMTASLIQNVREEPLDMEQLKNQPGITGVTMTEKDSLWNIAKAYHTTQKDILKTNQLEEAQVKEGTKLLLIKQITAR